MSTAFDVQDSIAAIASPQGPAMRGVIRLSGPMIDVALRSCFLAKDRDQLSKVKSAKVLPGQIVLGEPIGNVNVDLYYWPDTASYTRQRSAEIHCVGSPPVLQEILRTLSDRGVRAAEPGEFTMRAFLAGRIDLTQAEAVLGVIDSQSEQQMDVALRQLSGGVRGPIDQMQDELLEMLAHIEAGLDFVEDDIEFIAQEKVREGIDSAIQALDEILRQIEQRTIQNEVPTVVLFGRPNAGKSRLINALAENSASIVSNIAGTTRDYLVADVQWQGQSIQLIDTAGTMHDAPDGGGPIQAASDLKTDQVKNQATLQIICVDGVREVDTWEQAFLNSNFNQKSIIVRTKSDLDCSWSEDVRRLANSQGVMAVSSENGQGLIELRAEILQRLSETNVQNRSNVQNGLVAQSTPESGEGSNVEWVSATATRCRESLQNASQELQLARGYCRAECGEEIIAASLRQALDELAIVTGKVFTDDILDRVFSRFCIGK